MKGVVSGLEPGYGVWCRDVSGTYLIAPIDFKAFGWTRSGNTDDFAVTAGCAKVGRFAELRFSRISRLLRGLEVVWER